MPLTLPAFRRVATAVAAEEGGTLQLLATTSAEGSADYVEVIFGEPSVLESSGRVVITVKRRLTEPEIRAALRDGLRAYLQLPA